MSHISTAEPYIGYFRDARTILEFIDDSARHREQAARLAWPIGTAVIGPRQSVSDIPAEDDETTVNRAIEGIGGIFTTIGDEGIVLTRWLGPSLDEPGAEMWLGCSPHHPGQVAEIGLDPVSLRQEIASMTVAEPTLVNL